MPRFRTTDNQHGIEAIVTYRKETLLRVELKRSDKKNGPYKNVSAPHSSFERKIANDFQKYFAGKDVTFDYPLSFEDLTGFQQNVLAQLRKIPFGSVESYKSIAKKTGRPKACRAVGSACGKNRFPIIIPCHRVIKTDGSLGGFGPGPAIKQALLDLENKALQTTKRTKK
jgi:methylated-DNA-[protein]-cysteine S-methyltransferase